MSVTVRVDGAVRLRAALKRAGVQLADLKDVNARVASFVAQLAQTKAPRRTGRLAGSVRGNRAVGRATVSAGSQALPYAGPIHWGSPKQGIEAQPWIAETAQITEPAWLALYEREVNKIVDRV